VRFGLVLRPEGARPLDDLVAQARAAEEMGFDLLWVDEDHGGIGPEAPVERPSEPGRALGLPDALAVASAIAPHTSTVRIVACCRGGAIHPVYLAEQVAVADLVLGGRLVLALRSVPGLEECLVDVVDIVIGSQASAPMRRKGGKWPMPAELEGNRFGLVREVSVTPAPAQLEVPLWLVGGSPEVMDVATSRSVTVVGAPDEDASVLSDRWRTMEGSLGPSAARLRRVARRVVPVGSGGTVDADDLRDRLRHDQRMWRMDTVVLDPPPSCPTPVVLDLIKAVAQWVRPHLALAALPPGLAAHWVATRGDVATTRRRSTDA
jgi:alkanesulfonate monooxygenase SsuD/methylene tetrahydromethanopterin reductase-like flavin-dependent oxidoreductase (luciferase family)